MKRIEQDSLGSLSIPKNVLWGIQSYRASLNFPISGTQVHPEFIRSYLLLKKAAAEANFSAGVLSKKLKQTIIRAVDMILKSNFHKHFIIDAYQAGAGTSQNMNVNEVIANQANLILKKNLGSYFPIHPNNHVNMSQSTNDTYPTVLRLSLLQLSKPLLDEHLLLERSFNRKSIQFKSTMKAARTHLQDAVPLTLGQEFGGYAHTLKKILDLIQSAQHSLRELGIGGSAAGTGLNVPKKYVPSIIKYLQTFFHEPKLKLSKNLFSAMQSQLPIQIYSNALRALALELTRISNDLRLLSSGPLNGFSEIILPDTQPGSSIMPGKVNPSILEMTNQVCFKVLGNDTTVAYAMQAGQLELNVMMPIMAQATLESTALLTQTLRTLRLKCVDGIQANTQRCKTAATRTPAVSTALNPYLGYAKAAELTKEALLKEVSVLDLAIEKNLLTKKEIKKIWNSLFTQDRMKASL